jgi:hypothetical protein
MDRDDLMKITVIGVAIFWVLSVQKEIDDLPILTVFFGDEYEDSKTRC